MFERPFYAAAALIAASLAVAAGCGRHGTARVPVPAPPAPHGMDRNRRGKLVRIRLRRTPHCFGRDFRHARVDRGASHAAVQHLARGDQLQERKQVEVRVTDRGPLCRRTHHRSLDGRGGASIDMVRDGSGEGAVESDQASARFSGTCGREFAQRSRDRNAG